MLIHIQPPPAPKPFELEGPFDLERCVAALFYASGSQVILEGGMRPDGGVDLLTLHGGRSTVIQCKYWQKAVGVNEVRELLGAKIDFQASDATFVSTSGFTENAELFARRNRLTLIDANQLQTALTRYSQTREFNEAFAYFSRKCPKCGGTLVHRQNAASKEPFWGCSSFAHTGCKHSEPYDRRLLEPRAKAS